MDSVEHGAYVHLVVCTAAVLIVEVKPSEAAITIALIVFSFIILFILFYYCNNYNNTELCLTTLTYTCFMILIVLNQIN